MPNRPMGVGMCRQVGGCAGGVAGPIEFKTMLGVLMLAANMSVRLSNEWAERVPPPIVQQHDDVLSVWWGRWSGGSQRL